MRKRILHYLVKPTLLFYALPWLLVILTVGTVQQRYTGLYDAQTQFFSSFWVWLGPVPLPGMYATLSVIGISLTAKLLLNSPWRSERVGTIITHIGAVLLLVGALLTAISSEEGFITLMPNEPLNQVTDYHQRELAVLKNGKTIATFDSATLAIGQPLAADIPFTINVEATCRHCEVSARVDTNETYRGLAHEAILHPAPVRKEDEENQFGAVLNVHGSEQDGTYIAFEPSPHPPTIIHEGDTYYILAQKTRRALPFSVRLESFKKFTYPGSNIAEEYESVVTIIDGDISWKSPIRMNEPLRHKGYTLYQSSFIETADGEQFSVLAVVKNTGRVFPYIASIVMCIGLLIHLITRRRNARNTS